jgi:hypothetical protein
MHDRISSGRVDRRSFGVRVARNLRTLWQHEPRTDYEQGSTYQQTLALCGDRSFDGQTRKCDRNGHPLGSRPELDQR